MTKSKTSIAHIHRLEVKAVGAGRRHHDVELDEYGSNFQIGV